MAGGRCVHQDEVGQRLALELLDLAQHEHVADAGDGRRDHVEDPRARQPLGDPPQAVVLEILHERVVGGEPPGPDRSRDAPPDPAAGGRQQDLVVAQVLAVGRRRR